MIIRGFVCPFKVAQYERANVTYEVYLYEGATWITPEATLEFRQPLDQRGMGMSTTATSCPSSQLRSSSGRFYGTLDSFKTHILVSTGTFYISYFYPKTKQIKLNTI